MQETKVLGDIYDKTQVDLLKQLEVAPFSKMIHVTSEKALGPKLLLQVLGPEQAGRTTSHERGIPPFGPAPHNTAPIRARRPRVCPERFDIAAPVRLIITPTRPQGEVQDGRGLGQKPVHPPPDWLDASTEWDAVKSGNDAPSHQHPDAPAYVSLYSTPAWQCSSQPAACAGSVWASSGPCSFPALDPVFLSPPYSCFVRSTSPDDDDLVSTCPGSSSDSPEEPEACNVPETRLGGRGKAGKIPAVSPRMPDPAVQATVLLPSQMTGTETTILLRKLPIRTTPEELVSMLPSDGSVDFVHIPYNVRQRRRTRYAFINFTSHAAAQLFITEWSEQQADDPERGRVELGFAVVQGLLANAEHHRYLANVREAYRPIAFSGLRRIPFRQLLQDLGISE